MAQILGTGMQRAGTGSAVAVEDLELFQTKWTANCRAAELDTTNFRSFSSAQNISWSEGIYGIWSSDWSFSGDWAADQNMLSPDFPPGVFPRDDLQTLALIINVIDNPPQLWGYPYARVRSAESSSQVDGKISISASGMNQGEFEPPAGNIG